MKNIEANKAYYFVIAVDQYGSYNKGNYETYKEAESSAARALKSPSIEFCQITKTVSTLEPEQPEIRVKTTTF